MCLITAFETSGRMQEEPTALEQKDSVQDGFSEGDLIHGVLIQGGLAHDGTRQGLAGKLGRIAGNGMVDQKAYELVCAAARRQITPIAAALPRFQVAKLRACDPSHIFSWQHT